MSNNNILQFDVMVHGRFVCSLRMPITLDMVTDYVGDQMVINDKAICKYIEKKRPSLKGKPYYICF